MSEKSLLFLLTLLISALLLLLLYQYLYYKCRIKIKLTQISQKLQEISETGSDEKLMVFTDSPQLMDLAAPSP